MNNFTNEEEQNGGIMEQNGENSNEMPAEEPKSKFRKIKSFLKKPLVLIVLAIVLIGVGGYIYHKATNKPSFNYVEVEKGEIMQEVSVTGRVKPAESVDLAFEVGGKVGSTNVKVGDKVYNGQLLVSLYNGELVAQLAQAEANLSAEEAKLAELKKGTRPEEIKIAETALASAKSKADADLLEDYDAALKATQEGVVKGKNALLTLSDMQFKYFTGNEQEDSDIADAKKEAVEALLGAKNAGRLATEEVSKMIGGAYGMVMDAINNPTYDNIDKAISETLNALQKTKTALNVVPIKSEFTSTEKTNISTEKTTVNSSITTISSKEQAIAVQKVDNKNNIKSAEDNLALKKAGSTPEQISAQEAKVKSVQASVQDTQAKISKRIITAPISGVITKQDAKAGEIISANTVLVSLISVSKFEMEAYVPEVDVSKVSVGDSARVTLDAYGNSVNFGASIVSIEPAETMIEGVATYKTILQFIEDDERIKSGMTANVDIETDKKSNVLYVPARAVFTKDGKQYVKVLIGESEKETEVKTGIRGFEGNIEIIEGLIEGDRIII
ncbi:efflux RND transporter periplasmic adaptor subunit [Patescibacteria group bacterium]|nr:efflux RND transporter periplasmic adaptor subunit [Patescibacteria group bacterium]